MSTLLKSFAVLNTLPIRNCGWCARSILSQEYFTKPQQYNSTGLKAVLVK